MPLLSWREAKPKPPKPKPSITNGCLALGCLLIIVGFFILMMGLVAVLAIGAQGLPP